MRRQTWWKSALKLGLASLVFLTALPLAAAEVAELEAESGAGAESASAAWQFSAFGANTSSSRNPAPAVEASDALVLSATGGKIASGDEGLSFYFQEIPHEASYDLQARVVVRSFNQTTAISTPNQKSFGLMVRESVGEDGDASTQTSDYVAVGALDTVIKVFSKQQGTQTKLPAFANTAAPSQGQAYELRLRKSGEMIELSVNGQRETIAWSRSSQAPVYGGLYVARDAEIVFESYALTVDSRIVDGLQTDASGMKTVYRVGEELDLHGLQVKASFADGSEQLLTAADFFVTGFDSSQLGAQTLAVHYLGQKAVLQITVTELAMSALRIKYYPAKLTYYSGDRLDLQGLVVEASYDNSERVEELNEADYIVNVDGQPVVEGGQLPRLDEPGEATVTLTSRVAPTVSAAFAVTVKAADIVRLEIRQEPLKTRYYLGETLQLDGLVLYAMYSDGSGVRLLADEYEVSPLATDTPGVKQLDFSHKGQLISLAVTVQERTLEGLTVTVYPKTTYLVGEAFDASGLEVSKRYDNGDLEPYAAYTVDASAMDSLHPGLYEATIVAEESGLSPITLPITVRAPVEREWQSIRFGQSSSSANNRVELLDDGTIRLIALEGGGKVTSDHDGIAYYYTALDAVEDNFTLSANITVNAYAKQPHDGQEAFGIMARDVIGAPNTSSVFASNIAAVGGYSGGTRLTNGTQLFIRTGVESPDGAGSQGIRAIMLQEQLPGPDNTHPATTYRLTLAKTNSGFLGQLNDGAEAIFFEPDILLSQDGESMYVGFFAARLATIEVSGIDLQVSAAATDPPQRLPEPEPVVPELEILSREQTSESDYRLILRANVGGVVTVRQGVESIAEDVELTAGERLEIPAVLTEQLSSSFSVSFLPDDTQRLTHYDRIVRNLLVERKSYRDGEDIYVAPEGMPSGDGSIERPLDLDTAVAFVMPGQRIVVREGQYVRNSSLQIARYNDGREGAPKTIIAEPGARPVIDFNRRSEGVVLSGNHWHISGLDFARSAGNTKGFTIGGSYNIVENSRFYENGDTGLQISRTDVTEQDPANWPSYNLILNSTSFDNRDPSDNNADGFAAKLTSGAGNVFRGCIAHHNIDDGWDLYTKAGTGAIGSVLIEDSIAYGNGFLTDGTVGAGDKNGFKLGGEGIHVPHLITGSMAFGNGAYGFTSNSNPGVILKDNIAFDNARANLSLTTYPNIPTDFTLEGFVSFQQANLPKDVYPAELASALNYLFDGTASMNSEGVSLTAANFASLEPVATYEREADGTIIWGDFLRFLAPQPPEEPGVPGWGGYVPPVTEVPEVDAAETEPAEETDTNGEVRGAFFEDVPAGHWAYEAIRRLTEQDIIKGMAPDRFEPSGKIRRADFTLLLMRALGPGMTEGPDRKEPFSDSESGAYYYDALQLARDYGIVQGDENGRFRPHDIISRQDMMVMLGRALRAAGYVESFEAANIEQLVRFADRQSIAGYAERDIAWLFANGLVEGDPQGRLAPRQGASRAEAATLIDRALRIVPLP
ncbi:bacterial Ig-like domain-containing protein [Paenibacillus sp. CAU 1782]